MMRAPSGSVVNHRRRGAHNTLPPTRAQATWVLLAILSIVPAFASCNDGHRHGDLPFDRSRWNDADSRTATESERLMMVDDLIASGMLVGLDRRSVEDVLGRPSVESILATKSPQYRQNHNYRLGPVPLGADYYWLTLFWDAQGKVERAELVID